MLENWDQTRTRSSQNAEKRRKVYILAILGLVPGLKPVTAQNYKAIQMYHINLLHENKILQAFKCTAHKSDKYKKLDIFMSSTSEIY